jgi:hypothetical protein
MGMRSYVYTALGNELGRTHLVKEDEGADHLKFWRGQRPAHFEPAKITGARNDQRFHSIEPRVRAFWILTGVPAHVRTFLRRLIFSWVAIEPRISHSVSQTRGNA